MHKEIQIYKEHRKESRTARCTEREKRRHKQKEHWSSLTTLKHELACLHIKRE